jgi:hypothetical protein
LEEIILKKFNISENNISNVKLANGIRVPRPIACFCAYSARDHAFKEQKACKGCAVIRVFCKVRKTQDQNPKFGLKPGEIQKRTCKKVH